MHIFLCIDDTDNIESRGTGELAAIIASSIEEKGWGKCAFITRHQLFVHPDVPYTSHNSSMCFEADINEAYFESIISYASNFLENESAEGSDPGLCVVVKENITEPETLIEFGKKAKRKIITIKEAYDLASILKVHLSEHGGTGQGVIGALAGVGLRMSGNDGRLKGKIKLNSETCIESVQYIKARTCFDIVKDIKGSELKDNEMIKIGESLKAVYLNGKATLLVFSVYDEAAGRTLWKTCSKQQLSVY